MMSSSLITTLRMPLRAALAAVLAITIARYMRLEFPLYALIGAVIVTDLSAARTRQLGLARFAGTILGAALGAMVSSAFGHLQHFRSLGIGIGVLAAMLLSNLLGMKDTAKVAGYVCGIVLLNHTDQPWSYALQRTIETILGIGAAVLVSLIPKLDEVER